jgi:hypothetical protein
MTERPTAAGSKMAMLMNFGGREGPAAKISARQRRTSTFQTCATACWQHSPRLLLVQAIQREVGTTIRALRKQKGWSQDVFSDRS